jgi:hypothetical protein
VFPTLKLLTRRQLEILHLRGIKTLPSKKFTSIDLSQNLKFANVTKGRLGCLTPQGMKFMPHRVRYLCGQEALRMQGMNFPSTSLDAYSSAFLCNLAGNAFELSCDAAHFLCCMVLLSKNYKASCLKQMMPYQLAEAEFENGDVDVYLDQFADMQFENGDGTANIAIVDDDDDLSQIWKLPGI